MVCAAVGWGLGVLLRHQNRYAGNPGWILTVGLMRYTYGVSGDPEKMGYLVGR